MSSKDENFEIEYLEKYHGDYENVIEIIENCPQCGSKLIITHWADNSTLVMEENKRCVECDFGKEKTLHAIN